MKSNELASVGNKTVKCSMPIPPVQLSSLRRETFSKDPSASIKRQKSVTCFVQFFVEIRRFPLRSRSRIVIIHQTIRMRIRHFVRLTEDMHTPISLVSSRPKCTLQVPPHKLVHHTTHGNNMINALDLLSTIHPVECNLVVNQDLQTTMTCQMTMQHSRDHCHHAVFLHVPQGHRTHSQTQEVSCQECSNSFVRENHSVHLLHAFSFGIQAPPKKRVKGRSQ